MNFSDGLAPIVVNIIMFDSSGHNFSLNFSFYNNESTAHSIFW
jgi:hypothetical protein